jgi:hypothetical protein
VQVSAVESHATQIPPCLFPYVLPGQRIEQVPSGRRRYWSPFLSLPQEVAQPRPEQVQVVTLASHFLTVLPAGGETLFVSEWLWKLVIMKAMKD